MLREGSENLEDTVGVVSLPWESVQCHRHFCHCCRRANLVMVFRVQSIDCLSNEYAFQHFYFCLWIEWYPEILIFSMTAVDKSRALCFHRVLLCPQPPPTVAATDRCHVLSLSSSSPKPPSVAAPEHVMLNGRFLFGHFCRIYKNQCTILDLSKMRRTQSLEWVTSLRSKNDYFLGAQCKKQENFVLTQKHSGRKH